MLNENIVLKNQLTGSVIWVKNTLCSYRLFKLSFTKAAYVKLTSSLT